MDPLTMMFIQMGLSTALQGLTAPEQPGQVIAPQRPSFETPMAVGGNPFGFPPMGGYGDKQALVSRPQAQGGGLLSGLLGMAAPLGFGKLANFLGGMGGPAGTASIDPLMAGSSLGSYGSWTPAMFGI